MRRWTWIEPDVLLAIHEAQLAEHGGAGIRDQGLFESAIAKPRHLASYGSPDAAALAAAYGWGLCWNRAFGDGNKRTGFVAAELFLRLNGWRLAANDADAVPVMLGVASGDVDEPAFATWLRTHSKR